MIADTAVLSSSPWQNDQFLTQETLQSIDGSDADSLTFDMEVAELEAEIERMKHQTDLAYNYRHHSQSCGTSVASSECSDELTAEVDDTGTMFTSLSNSDYFTSGLLSILAEAQEPDPDPFPCFVLSDMELVTPSSCMASPELHTHSAGAPPDKPTAAPKKTATPPLAENKPWTSLCSTEQVDVVESLTNVISRDLGLREQLEIIRIINPQAAVASTDTEFVIDLSCFNDEKLHRVREYIRQHSRMSSCPSDDSNCSDTGISTPKKQTKRQQCSQRKERRQRQRKEYRQMMKEKKSGLFGKEEVLSLSQDTPLDEDIDILT